MDDSTLKQLMKGIKEVKVEMNVSKKHTRPSTLYPSRGQKGFAVGCIWCHDPGHM